MNLFVWFFDDQLSKLVTDLKELFESIYSNYDHSLLGQVTINTKKPDYIYPIPSVINLCTLVV